MIVVFENLGTWLGGYIQHYELEQNICMEPLSLECNILFLFETLEFFILVS